MGKSLADNGFITEMKDKNGDSWYHQIVLEAKDEEIERLNNIISELDSCIKKYSIDYVDNEGNYLHSVIKTKYLDKILKKVKNAKGDI